MMHSCHVGFGVILHKVRKRPTTRSTGSYEAVHEGVRSLLGDVGDSSAPPAEPVHESLLSFLELQRIIESDMFFESCARLLL